MDKVNLSLDQIITLNKQQSRGNNRRAGGSFRGGRGSFQNNRQNLNRSNDGRIGKPRPNWAPRFPGNFLPRQPVLKPLSDVRVDVSNLHAGVKTSDLIELFAAYSPRSVHVHYDEFGKSLGTADVTFVTMEQANLMMQHFRGVILDGLPMKMALVTEQARLIIPRNNFQPQNRYNNNNNQGFRNDFNKFNRGFPGGRRGRGRGFGNRGAGGGASKPKKTEEELNKELEAYMKKP